MNYFTKDCIKVGSITLAAIACFFLGRLSVIPKTITKTVIQEQKIYDLTQKPEVIEAYANLIGKTLCDKKEVEWQRHKIWQEGFIEGVKARGKR